MDTLLANRRLSQPRWLTLQTDDVYLPLPNNLSAVTAFAHSLRFYIIKLIIAAEESINGGQRSLDSIGTVSQLIPCRAWIP